LASGADQRVGEHHETDRRSYADARLMNAWKYFAF